MIIAFWEDRAARTGLAPDVGAVESAQDWSYPSAPWGVRAMV